MHRTYVVGLRSYLVLGAVCCIFFIGCSVGAFLAKQYGPILVFGFFVIMGLAFWSESDKAEAFDLMRSKLDRSDIKSYPSNLADYKIHKNVRA